MRRGELGRGQGQMHYTQHHVHPLLIISSPLSSSSHLPSPHLISPLLISSHLRVSSHLICFSTSMILWTSILHW
jgi:hypothetical protein